MAGRNVENARELTRQVAEGLRKYARPAAEEVDGKLYLGDAKPYGLAVAMDVAANRLEQTFISYEQSDAAVISEAEQDDTKRLARSEVTRELKLQLSVLTGSVDSTYGREGIEVLNLTGPTPVSPHQLVKKAKHFLAATENGIPKLPEPRQPWSVPDLAEARVAVAKIVAKLEKALEVLNGNQRETRKARDMRDQFAVEWHQELRFGADLARTLLYRANQEDLAARKLPSERQIIRIEPDEPTPDTG